MLMIFSGLPGVGKTTLAKAIALEKQAVYLRVDTVEQALKNAGMTSIYDEGYQAITRIAADNLKLEKIVVLDSTNPVADSRQLFHDVAEETNSHYIDIEVMCSDEVEHKKRIETRKSDIKGLILPHWESVQEREFLPWQSPRIIVDTAHKSVGICLHELCKKVAN